MSDVEIAFNHLVNSLAIRYKGCLIFRNGVKFSWSGVNYDTEEQAKAAIDKQLQMFGLTLNRLKA